MKAVSAGSVSEARSKLAEGSEIAVVPHHEGSLLIARHDIFLVRAAQELKVNTQRVRRWGDEFRLYADVTPSDALSAARRAD